MDINGYRFVVIWFDDSTYQDFAFTGYLDKVGELKTKLIGGLTSKKQEITISTKTTMKNSREKCNSSKS